MKRHLSAKNRRLVSSAKAGPCLLATTKHPNGLEIEAHIVPGHLSEEFRYPFESALLQAFKPAIRHRYKAGIIFLGSPFATVAAWHWTGLIVRALDTAEMADFNSFQQFTFSAGTLSILKQNPKNTRIFLLDDYEQIHKVALRSANELLSAARGYDELIG